MFTRNNNRRIFVIVFSFLSCFQSNWLAAAASNLGSSFEFCLYDQKCSLADENGNVLTDASFEKIYPFEGKYAIAVKNGLYGVIGLDGRWKIEPKFDSLSLESDNQIIFAVAGIKNKYGYINNKGIWVIAPNFDATYAFENGQAAVKKNGYWGIINKAGKWVIKPQFTELKTLESYPHRFIAKKSDFWGVVDQKAKWVLNPEYSGIAYSKLGQFNSWIDKKDTHKPFDRIRKTFDINGKEMVTPSGDRNFFNRDFSCESITTNGVTFYGLMNIKGQWLVEPKFQDANCFQDETSKDAFVKHDYSDLVPVKLNSKWGLIDRMGNWVINPQYDHSFRFSRYGFAEASQHGLWGLINTEGKWVIEPKYRNIIYNQESPYISVNSEGLWGVKKLDGTWLIPAKFSNLEYVGKNLIKAGILDGTSYLFNSDGATLLTNYNDCGRTKTIKNDGTVIAKPQTISQTLLQKCIDESNSKYGWEVVGQSYLKSGNRVIDIKCSNSNSFFPDVIIQQNQGFSSICSSCSSTTLETTAYRTCYLKTKNDAWPWWED